MSDAPAAGTDRVAVVVPAYRAAGTVRAVVDAFAPLVDLVVVVDDGSGDDSGNDTGAALDGAGAVLLRHDTNRGVGAATRTGIEEALRRGADIVVKVDADGQMCASDLENLIAPLRARAADATKGNRWFHGRELARMPPVRRCGNLVLGFLVRAATGCWRTFDPTNGYVAWRAELLRLVDLDAAEDRFRFEISMLRLLADVGAVVHDVPMPARYGDSGSHLSPCREAPGLALYLLQALISRVWRQYFVHDFNAVSLFLLTATPLLAFGVVFGAWHWSESIRTGVPATAGTVLLAALPTLLGVNLLVQAVVLDIGRAARDPLTRFRGSA